MTPWGYVVEDNKAYQLAIYGEVRYVLKTKTEVIDDTHYNFKHILLTTLYTNQK